jgi:hypothetical protein
MSTARISAGLDLAEQEIARLRRDVPLVSAGAQESDGLLARLRSVDDVVDRLRIDHLGETAVATFATNEAKALALIDVRGRLHALEAAVADLAGRAESGGSDEGEGEAD